MKYVLGAAALAMALSTMAPAEEVSERSAVLLASGDTVEVAGRTATVIAFYREDGDLLDVSLVVRPDSDNGAVLRSGAVLADRASMTLRLSAFSGGRTPDILRVKRQGRAVHLSVTTEDLPVARATATTSLAAKATD